MKKILFFIRSLDVGGAERQLVLTAKGLSKQGYNVTVLTFYSGGVFAEELLSLNVRVLSLHKKGRWDLVMFFYRLVSVLRDEAPDVVYSFLGGANIFAVLARFFIPHTRIIWGVRSSDMDLDKYDRITRWSYWLECRLAHLVDKIVTNSYAGREYALANGFPSGKMVVIANGIDAEHFRPNKVAGERVRKAWGIGKNERLIGLVGRIDPMKGHPTFFQAAALVKKQLPDIRFVCVGHGETEYKNSMRELVAKMGLDDVLIWKDGYSNLMEVYNAFDLACSSSSFGEGFPNVVGEAMSCGVPCVVTDVGDSALIVGQAGLVVPPNDSKAMSLAWIEILSLEAMEFQAMAVAARDRVTSQFSVRALLKNTERLWYKKILFFIRSLDVGGAERQLVLTAKGLSKQGYNVTVLTFYSGGVFAEELLSLNVRVLSLHKKGRWDLVMFFYRLVSVLRDEAPDVVYSFLGGANIFAVLARFFIPHTRIIWGVRSSDMDLDKYDRITRWSYWLECRLAHLVDKIVTNSYAGREYALANGFPSGKMVVIANGIDAEHFRPNKVAGERVRKAWGIGKNERLIGLVGRIDPMKGHPTFFQAAALVKKQLPDIRFVCVGHGETEYKNSMRELVAKMGLDDVLIWKDGYSNLMEVYNAFDLACSSSSFGEGFPNVVGEAMSCGVPCVVTDVGDSALIVGQAGLVVPPNDSKAMSLAWIEMLSLEAMEFQAMAVAARDRVTSQFSINTLLNSTEQSL